MLVAVTTYCALDAVWNPVASAVVVDAVLERQPPEKGQALDFNRVRQELAGDDALREALQSAGLSSDPATLATWRSWLSVYRDHDPRNPNSDWIVVEVYAPGERLALDVADALTRHFVEQQAVERTSAQSPQLVEARQTLAQARTSEEEARRALDGVLRDHYDRLRKVDVERATEESGSQFQLPRATTRQESPQWQKIAEEIARLETERQGLLVSLKPAHPRVRKIDHELQELQSRRERTPRYLAGDEVPAPEDQTPPRGERELVAAARAMAEEKGRLRAALDTYEAARGRRLEAEAAVEVLERSTAEGPKETGERFALVQSARVVQRIPAVSRGMQILILLAASKLALIVTLCLARPRRVSPLLVSADDVAAALGVPVVARLKLPSTRLA